MRWAVLSVACLAAVAAAPAWGQQDEAQALRREMQDLRQTLEAMQRRLDALEQRPSAVEAPVASSPPAVAAPAVATSLQRTQVPGVAQPVLPQRDSVADPSTAASRPDNAAGPTDPDLKGFFAIPGTDTVIRIGGYAKLDAIADSRAAGDEDQFVPSSIPVGSGHRDVSNFNMHAKQTRFSFEARRPTTHGNLRFYLENDFYGSSDGYQFRLRHAYGQLGNTYAGYGYSSFMDADSLPDTLDFAGPGGAGYLLVAGIHHNFSLGKGTTLTVAAEKPETELVGGDADRIAVNRVPDVTVTARMEREWGHLQIGAVGRSLGFDTDTRRDRTVGGGLQLSGSASVGERDLLLFGVLGGRGLARYTADLTGSGLDAVVDGNGRLRALDLRGGFVGYTHYWSSLWRSNLIYGQLTMERNAALAADAFRQTRYGVFNLIWSPAPSWTMGMELLYGQLEQQGGNRSDTVRVQGSLQYNFIK
ncbi:DcaP family trimeric outer membrane transporter [Stenotrophomonas sp. 24(2023)]|uniref:DcaP family trimeric outer membrane transporter n=1 Tax=Stenotrophomonas sp. 24(2023) TaxID=3068324 RepID=UPI0027E07038|nr:DcaP family trimeric outer membrane transporter [Stenotrophomonas sp. 24(2023)]WMJ69588.1 DcaP family trimeric outer membrane transporter [Stenotrophomonas sp. 24(2023)]